MSAAYWSDDSVTPVGNTDKSAAKHGRETGHATIVETIPERGNGAGRGMIETSEAAPDLTPEPPLTTKAEWSPR